MKFLAVTVAAITLVVSSPQVGSAALSWSTPIPGTIVPATAGAPAALTSCEMTRSGEVGIPTITVRNQNALRSLITERVRVRAYGADGLVLGDTTMEWLDVSVSPGDSGLLGLEGAQTYAAFEHFEAARNVTCELTYVAFNDGATWGPGNTWKAPVIAASGMASVPILVSTLASWTTNTATGTIAHVRLRVQTAAGAVTVHPQDFVASLRLADGSVASLRGSTSPAPLVVAANTGEQTPAVDPSEDLGALGSVTLQPHDPKSVVITYVPDETPLASEAFVGVTFSPK